MRILALITARGGSKRLPGKNIRTLGGKPLIVWSIDGVKNIPVTYLIDPKGVILGRALGVREWANLDLLAFIKSQF